MVNCPSCGAPVKFKSSISLLVVCEYCKSLLLRKDLNLELLGKVGALLADGSPVQLGVQGRYKEIAFGVIGRLQLRTPSGTWNEWHLQFEDARQGWLGEAQGQYTVSFRAEPSGPLPAYAALKPGARVAVDRESYTVRDKREAEYVSAEGELPFRVPFGQPNPFADLSGPGDAFATLDYSEDPPLLFLGRHVPFADLKMIGLKEFEGW